MTVREMLGRITSKEITEWRALYKLDPWGEKRADLRSGIIASTMANIHSKKGKTYKPKKFMPEFEKKKQSPKEMLKIVEHLNAAFGGRDLRDKE